MSLAVLVALALSTGAAADEPQDAVPRCEVVGRVPGGYTRDIEDRVDLIPSDNPAVRAAVGWLGEHIVTVSLPTGPADVIAWWDPTLHPAGPANKVAYTATDTLWASRALAPYDPTAARALREGLRDLGWHGSGLHEVLFAGVDRLALAPSGPDPVHGVLLAECPLADGGAVSVRTPVLRPRERAVERGPKLFADAAVYVALQEHWSGDTRSARKRIKGVLKRQGRGDKVFWDRRRGVLVDASSYRDYEAFVRTDKGYGMATYKLGLVLYAARLLSVKHRALDDLTERLHQSRWSMERARHTGMGPHAGGYAHIAFFRAGSWEPARLSGPTGEATAMAVLAESVVPESR